jgi:hypothetical protein
MSIDYDPLVHPGGRSRTPASDSGGVIIPPDPFNDPS